MPEEVLFKSESDQSREEIASYLRKVADTLDSGDAINLKAGAESVTLNPPARPTFEVKAEREGPAGNMTERSIEFELEWDENDGDVASQTRTYVRRISDVARTWVGWQIVYSRSKRSRVITLLQASTKSWTNFSSALSAAYTSPMARSREFAPKTRSKRVPCHSTSPVSWSRAM